MTTRGPAVVRFLVAASEALLLQSAYFDTVSNSDLSTRWETAVDKSLASLLLAPEGGAPLDFSHPALAGLRRWRIPNFPNHLLIYRYLADEHRLVIVDVPHGSRQLQERLRLILEHESYDEYP